MNQSAAPDLNIIRMRSEEEDFFTEEIHDIRSLCEEGALPDEAIFSKIGDCSPALACGASVATNARNDILLFCRQNATDNFGHHQFAIAVEPFLGNGLNLADQRFVFIPAIEHGCPQFAVFS